MSTRVSSTHDGASGTEAPESKLGSNGGLNGALLMRNKATLSQAWKLSMPVLQQQQQQQQQQQSASKKLLVLDVNGLLVARFKKSDKGKPPNVEHVVVAKTCIYKRPLCDAFLQFCLENFHVGIWSSMMECNVNKVVDYICMSSTTTMTKHQFAFVMHQKDCTKTKFTNTEKRKKLIFLKDLRKVWARFQPGEFSEKNTLLIDDTPYKALHNPPDTAIFPEAYMYDETDTFLMGPLRQFLVQLVGAPDVQEFVRSHPIGAPAINPGSSHWGLYREIVTAWNNKSHSQVSNSHSPVHNAESHSQVSNSHTPVHNTESHSQVSNSHTPVHNTESHSQVSNSHTPVHNTESHSQVSNPHTPVHNTESHSQVSNSHTPVELMEPFRVLQILRKRAPFHKEKTSKTKKSKSGQPSP